MSASRLIYSPLSLLTLCAALAGCAVNQQELAPTASGAAPASITGKVFGGQQPITGAAVTLWGVGYTAYGGTDATLFATTQTDSSGNFDFSNAPAYTCQPGKNRPMYILASGGNPGLPQGSVNHQIVLGAGIGRCGDAPSVAVNVNEVTTAVLAYTMGHFFNPTVGGDYTTDTFGGPPVNAGDAYNAGIDYADDYTIPQLVNLSTGTVQPNGTALGTTTTIESAKIDSLANSLAACVNSSGIPTPSSKPAAPQNQAATAQPRTKTSACQQLFSLTTPPNGNTAPSDTLQAAVQVALYPWQNVPAIYNLGSAVGAPFPGLSRAPNDWTLGVSYTATSDFALSINAGTSSNIDINVDGGIYFPTDAPTKAGAGYFDPTTGIFSGPYHDSDLNGSLRVHPQYIAIGGGDGDIAISDLGDSTVYDLINVSYSTNGFTGPISGLADLNSGQALFYFTAGGTLYGPGRGLYSFTRSAGVAPQIAQFNSPPNAIALYKFGSEPDVDASTTVTYPGPCLYENFYVGNQGVEAISSGSPCTAGGIAETNNAYDGVSVTSTNQICTYGSHQCFDPPLALNNPQGVALDGDDNFWVANSGNASVSTFGHKQVNYNATDFFPTSTVQYIHDANNGNTMSLPYGLAIDNGGNVWVSNAGCISIQSPDQYCTPGPFVLTELVGAAAPTITPLATQNIDGTQGTRPRAPTSSAVHRHADSRSSSLTRP